VRILYNGEKIWVKPISMFRETITGKVVTLFCNPGKDAEITFLAKDIVGMNRMGGIKFKKNISNKYKISV
jgi:hypothetical protein